MAKSQQGRVTLPNFRLRPSSIIPWIAILAFIVAVSAGLAAGVGSILELLYPMTAFGLGAFLFVRYPALYLGFMWWIWFLTPLVRRIVDYQAGWNPQSLVMLAPYLVAGLVFFTVLQNFPKLQLRSFLPFGMILFGILYGYGTGIIGAGPRAATYDMINWAVPVMFALYIALNWRDYPRYRQTIQRTFTWGILVMGSYGLVQFFNPLPWDRYWMLNAPISSIGQPLPFEIRVFSTLNSPGPFAIVMLAGLLLLFSDRGVLRWLATAPAYAGFLLSLVRSAWGGWVIGALFIAFRSRGASRIRLLAAAALMGVVLLPLLTVGPLAETVNERLQTTTQIGEDNSFQARINFYSETLPQALLNPIGQGLGGAGMSTRLASESGESGEFGVFDSGLLLVPFVLGWPGTILYAGGLAWLALDLLRSQVRSDNFATIGQSIVLVLLAQLAFSSTLTAVSGMVLWSFLGLLLAARLHRTRSSARNSDDARSAIGNAHRQDVKRVRT